MLTQFFQSINWVDVALAILFIRVVFVSVQTGFIAEVFRNFGIIVAVFVSLHYYSKLADMVASKTNLSEQVWQLIFFVALWLVIVLAFKFLHDGIMLLFKAETTHKGFDKYAGGFLGGARAIFICSLTIFALMLVQNAKIHQMTLKSVGHKVAAKAAPNTYKFLHENLIGKLFEGEAFNSGVFTVIGSHGVNPK